MPLQKANVPVVFSGGIDQKTSKQLVVPGSFAALENCVRQKAGGIDRRFGTIDASRSYVDMVSPGTTGTISSAVYLATRNDELFQLGTLNPSNRARHLLTYSESNDKWIDVGASLNVPCTFDQVENGSLSVSQPDIAVDGANFTVAVYSYTGSFKVVVYDINMNLVHTAFGVGDFPRVAYTSGGQFIIGSQSAGNINFSYLSTSDFTITSIGSTAATAGTWDLIAYSSTQCAFVCQGAAAALKLGLVTNAGISTGTLGTCSTQGFGLFKVSGSTDLYVGYYTAGNAVAVRRVTSAFANVWNTALTGGLAAGRNITICEAVDLTLGVFYELAGATPDLNGTYKTTVSTAGAQLTSAALFRAGAGLASKAFTNGGSLDPMVWLAHDSSLQSCYFLADYDGRILSHTTAGKGGGVWRDALSNGTFRSGLPSVVFLTSIYGYTVLSTILGTRSRATIASGGTIASVTKGLQRVDADLSGPFTASSGIMPKGTTVGGSHLLSGGSVQMYDGYFHTDTGFASRRCATTELGFFLYPERIGVVTTPVGGSLAAGSYCFRVVYEWIDAQGLTHQSAPSILSDLYTAALNDKLVFTVPTLRMTDKDNVRIVVYVSDESGDPSLLYRTTDVANDSTVDSVNYEVLSVDTSAAILYTTGGVLENICAPPSLDIHQHRGRMFAASAEDGNVYISKKFSPGEGVSFVDAVYVNMDRQGGIVRAMETLDDKLILFKKDRMYVLLGDGPVNTGQQNDYQDPELIVSDVGSIYPRSIVSTSAGIYFQSDKGVYLLTRALTVQYIGAPLEDTISTTFLTSAVLNATKNEIRWTQGSNSGSAYAYVYNYYFNQWMTFKTYDAVSACSWKGQYCRLDANGYLYLETTNDYAEYDGTAIPYAIETGWLAFAGLAGFQRLYRLTLLGEIRTSSPPQIVVKLAYDYVNTYTETINFTPSGTTGDYVNYEIAPARQKCEAVKLRIEVNTGVNAGYRLVNMSALIGRKGGQTKFPLASQAGGRT